MRMRAAATDNVDGSVAVTTSDCRYLQPWCVCVDLHAKDAAGNSTSQAEGGAG